MGAMTLGLFSKTHIASSLCSPTKTDSTVLKCPKLYIKLVVGTVRISTLAKPNGNCMTEKLNTSRQSPVTVIDQLLQNTSAFNWSQFDKGPFFLARGKSDTHCKIKETLLIRDLKSSLNENISSEKLYLY